MSPLDRELEQALARRAEPVTPPADLLGGVERKATSIRNRRRALSAATGVAVLALVAGTTFALRPDKQETGFAPPGPTAPVEPSPSTEPTPSTEPSPPPTSTQAVYYVGDTTNGPRLYREFRRVQGPSPAHAALLAMLHEPPLDSDYTSVWPTATEALTVSVDGDVATVDLGVEARNANVGAEQAELAVQQLVYTVTAAQPAVKKVAITIGGQPEHSLWGHEDVSTPRGRASQTDVLAPIWITEPAHGATVGRTLTFGGQATVFEATVTWEIHRVDCPSGTACPSQLLKQSFATADNGAPERGDWSATFSVPTSVPKGAVLEIRAFESSAEDGRPRFVDTKRVTLAA